MINQLMIGNFVSHKGIVCEVLEIMQECCTIKSIIDGAIYQTVMIDFIPITNKLIENFGFKESNFDFEKGCYSYIDQPVYLKSNKGIVSPVDVNGDIIGETIIAVHQLQNWVFLTTGCSLIELCTYSYYINNRYTGFSFSDYLSEFRNNNTFFHPPINHIF